MTNAYASFKQIRDFAIEGIQKCDRPLTALEKISVGRQYKVAKWLVEGYTYLIRNWGKPDSPTISDFANDFGWERAARLADLAARLKPLTARVVASAGVIQCPSESCVKLRRGGSMGLSAYMQPSQQQVLQRVEFVLDNPEPRMGPSLPGEYRLVCGTCREKVTVFDITPEGMGVNSPTGPALIKEAFPEDFE